MVGMWQPCVSCHEQCSALGMVRINLPFSLFIGFYLLLSVPGAVCKTPTFLAMSNQL